MRVQQMNLGFIVSWNFIFIAIQFETSNAFKIYVLKSYKKNLNKLRKTILVHRTDIEIINFPGKCWKNKWVYFQSFRSKVLYE